MSVSRHAFSLGSAFIVGSTTFSAEVHAQAANWTFSYVGAVAGYDWNNIDVDGIGTIDADGFAGGALAGINFYQSGNFVAGIEADVMWIDGSGSVGSADGFSTAGCSSFRPQTTSVSADVNWKASVRARAGYLVTPVTLVYATAGVAFADVDVASAGLCPGSITKKFVGGVVGGGTETQIAPNLYGRLEVLYYNFGEENLASERFVGPTNTPVPVQTSVDLDETVARAALVLRLN
jgi:outer membrane immunogenic protein